MTWLGHYWDTLGTGNTYSSQAIVVQACDYEVSVTAPSRGVKIDSVYKLPSSPGSSAWSSSQTDTYGYDAKLDYLTAARYGDGLANASPTWSYDAAGNRNDAVTDNLNRPTSLGGTTVTNDILGNMITKGSTTCGWDILDRMTSFTSSSGVTNYIYRADGMRVSKSNSGRSTSYRYDGQMGMEDVDFASNGTLSKVTDYRIGLRGVDAIYITQSGTAASSYPIYDVHGNMVSTLTRQGSGGFAYSALRTYNAWGIVRRGALTGDPRGRYCVNLGHKQDDESEFIYMRARYYDATRGRFTSEDAKSIGRKWFAYCSDCPTCRADNTGADDFSLGGLTAGTAGTTSIEGSLGGTAYWANLSVDSGSLSTLGVFINAINGERGVSTLMTALRANAIESGFVRIVQTGGAVAGSRAEVFAQYARNLIITMGDNAMLPPDSDVTMLYWMISE